jgi:hypothetical protein
MPKKKNKLKTEGKGEYCDNINSIKFVSEKETEQAGMNMGLLTTKSSKRYLAGL